MFWCRVCPIGAAHDGPDGQAGHGKEDEPDHQAEQATHRHATDGRAVEAVVDMHLAVGVLLDGGDVLDLGAVRLLQ